MNEKDDNDDPNLVRGEYVQTEPKFLGDLRLRLGKWLEEERGWGLDESLDKKP